ncbi:hypothetical protein WK58_09280 [Burkholderia ubonensis]|nr:hypothetical protein WK58_09280 [Burkholderia ubonensis]
MYQPAPFWPATVAFDVIQLATVVLGAPLGRLMLVLLLATVQFAEDTASDRVMGSEVFEPACAAEKTPISANATGASLRIE